MIQQNVKNIFEYFIWSKKHFTFIFCFFVFMQKGNESSFLSKLFWAGFDLILYSSIVSPYLLYYFYSNEQNAQIIFLSNVLRIISLAAITIAILKAGINKPGLLFFAIPLILGGQYLNLFVYNVLDTDQTILKYGFSDLRTVYFHGFPFTLRYPQFKGTIMTIAGGLFLCNVTKRTTIAFMLWMLSIFLCISKEAAVKYPY